MFHPSAKDWPARHKILGYIFLVALIMLALGYLLYLRPKQSMLLQKRAQVREKADKFAKTNLPQDIEVLQEHLKKVTTLLNGDENLDIKGLVTTTDEVLTRATSFLEMKIHENYSDILAFIYGATRLDYKELLEQVVSEFTQDGLTSEAQFLDAGLDIQEQPVWQMMVKLWTIQDILKRANSSGLKLSASEEGTVLLSALPIVGYTLNSTDSAKIYLLEIPVSATFTGTMNQFLNFAEGLQKDSSFLPMKRLVIRTLPPEELLPGMDNSIEQCQFTIQCSEFMAPHGLEGLNDSTYEEENAESNSNSKTKENK